MRASYMTVPAHARGRTRLTGTLKLFLGLIIALTCWPGASANAAAEPLDIRVEAGFDGKAKEGRWYPVKITVVNPGNDDLSGELVVQMGTDGQGKDVAYTRRLDLPKGGTKVVWFSLPGKMMNSKNNVVRFYRDGLSKGDPVPTVQDDPHIETQMIPPNALTVGVLARDPDTLNFLALLNQTGSQVHVFRLTDKEFPWEAGMLDMLDAVVLNDVATDTLPPQAASELEQWVRRGGKLYLAGGAGYPKTAAALNNLSPVEYQGTTALSTLARLAQVGGKELVLNAPFTVSKAAVRSGETVHAEAGVPLAVKRPLDRGEVWYLAYDLALQPVASWPGNPQWWRHLLGDVAAASTPNMPKFGPGGYWELQHALDYFPELAPPAFGVLAGAFLVYIVIVAPAAYFVLKRFDRCEWAWFVVPAIALLSTFAIYRIGASDRSSTLSQTLSVTELTGTGGGIRTSGIAVFVPSGGDYALEWEGDRQVSPPSLSGNWANQMNGEANVIVEQLPDQSRVRFLDVPYWSISKAIVVGEPVADQGKFAYSLEWDANGLKGEIRNETNADLTEVGIVAGQQWIPLGDLKKGESKTFNAGQVNMTNFFPPEMAHRIFPYQGRNDNRFHQRSLLEAYLNDKWNKAVINRSAPIVLGWSREQRSDALLDGKALPSNELNLVVQEMTFSYVKNNVIVVPKGAVIPSMSSSSLSHIHPNPVGFDLGRGEFVLEYPLPNPPGAAYEKIQVTAVSTSTVRLEVWNEGDQTWEPIDRPSVEWSGEAAKRMLVGGHLLRIKGTSSQDNGPFAFPEIAAEGRVTP